MSDEAPEQRDGLRAADLLHVGQLTVRSDRGGVVYAIRAEGELDLATAEQLERELKRAESTDALGDRAPDRQASRTRRRR